MNTTRRDFLTTTAGALVGGGLVISLEEVDKLPHEEHMKFEQDRMARCIAYLNGILDELQL